MSAAAIAMPERRVTDRRGFAVGAAARIAAGYLKLGKSITWDDRTRTGPECVARQIAIYLLVAGLGLERQSVAQMVGRHHSTVEHAMGIIESRRDDPDFDAAMTRLELELRLSVAAEDIAG